MLRNFEVYDTSLSLLPVEAFQSERSVKDTVEIREQYESPKRRAIGTACNQHCDTKVCLT